MASGQGVTGANTDLAQCVYVFCPFCGVAAPWRSFKFSTAVARLQRLIFRGGAAPCQRTWSSALEQFDVKFSR